MDKIIKKLQEAAIKASENSYSPYSNFKVGAAILTFNNKIITGNNIENRSYGLTICAERNAIFSAISSGFNNFIALSLYCPDSKTPVPPCGACRQVLSEFVNEDFPIYYACEDKKFHKLSIKELLPYDSLFNLKKTKR